MTLRNYIILSVTLLMFAGCAVKDDIPYPIVDGAITSFQVEGQCDETDGAYADATINKNDRTVTVNVSDTVDISKLRITLFEVSNDAEIIPNDSLCIEPDNFPSRKFYNSTSSYSTAIDFTNGAAEFILRTYQDYKWTVYVHQVFLREVQLSGQVGNAVIDKNNHNVVVYVSAKQDLSKITVSKFSLGGQHGTVTPDPTATSTFDFSRACTFQVSSPGKDEEETWHVYVYQTDVEEETTASAFARSISATVSGTIPNGTSPVVEYHLQGASDWITVPENQVSFTSTSFEAELTGLKPSTAYEYRVTAGSSTTATLSFTTAGDQQMENASFDNWSITDSNGNDLYQPWGVGEECYWDTGNHGATTVGASNSTYVNDGTRCYANLQSKYIVIKFAAGNIFTGQYLKTDGSNGILSFGRPFTSFPTKLRFDYKYKTSTVTRSAPWSENYARYISKETFDNLKGNPDSCSVYIALGDWIPETFTNKGVEYSCPYLIRTRPSELQLFDLEDEHLIAYAQMTQGDDVTSWTTETLTLNYRVKNRQPKYIIVVASSSKYGDYFAGGESSLLQIDDMKLLYE